MRAAALRSSIALSLAMTALAILASVPGVLFAQAAAKKPEGLRTWTDSTGKQKIEAELIEFKGGNVTLKNAQGRTMTLPLEKFSKEDQKLIRASQPTTGPDGQSLPDVSGNKMINLKASQKWTLEAEKLPVVAGSLVESIPLSTKIGDGFAENVAPLGFDR